MVESPCIDIVSVSSIIDPEPVLLSKDACVNICSLVNGQKFSKLCVSKGLSLPFMTLSPCHAAIMLSILLALVEESDKSS
jgi:hypothetical protein